MRKENQGRVIRTYSELVFPVLGRVFAVGALLLGLNYLDKYLNSCRPSHFQEKKSENRQAVLPASSIDNLIADSVSRLLHSPANLETAAGSVSTNTAQSSIPSGTNNTYLIEDSEFTNSNFATQQEIQTYLESRNSALAKKIDEILFSEKVLEESQEHRINPLLLVARAQTEQGAITKSKLTQKEINELMGYGVTDIGRIRETSGFRKQIEGSAKTLRKHYDLWEGQSISLNYGQTNVFPGNASEHSLYTYTPHTDGTILCIEVYNSIKRYMGK